MNLVLHFLHSISILSIPDSLRHLDLHAFEQNLVLPSAINLLKYSFEHWTHAYLCNFPFPNLFLKAWYLCQVRPSLLACHSFVNSLIFSHLCWAFFLYSGSNIFLPIWYLRCLDLSISSRFSILLSDLSSFLWWTWYPLGILPWKFFQIWLLIGWPSC